jgi:hypothetical protein
MRPPISKTTRAKWTGGVAQEVPCLLCEHLLCRHEALSSSPSPTKKKERERQFLVKKLYSVHIKVIKIIKSFAPIISLLKIYAKEFKIKKKKGLEMWLKW